MKLVCVSPYSDDERRFTAGQEFEIDDEIGEYIQRCSPESFVIPSVEPEGDKLSSQKVDDLRALAAERGVDLGGAKTKAEIIAALRTAALVDTNRMQTDGESR